MAFKGCLVITALALPKLAFAKTTKWPWSYQLVNTVGFYKD
jgi:hypothetical protein